MLTGGVVISMFTAIVVTRLIFDHTTDPNRTKPFKMVQFFKNPNFDFVALGNKTLLISTIIIVVTLGLFTYRVFTKPTSVLAVDLTGGTSIVYDVKAGEANVGEIRKAINSFDNAALIQTGDNGSILSIKTGVDKGDTESQIKKLIDSSETLKGLELELKSCDQIGPTVGNDLRSSGTKAVIFSLIAILIYIGFRFRFGFGLGGIVALAHDAFIALGLFSLCGRQVSLIVVTALLTIIGYSINDTVVVFDRIREILKRDSRTPLKDVCNAAINSCLGRTFITSLTTFFTVAVLFIFVDGSIYDFALTMLFGIIAGTYSSVFIATPVMMWWYRNKRPSFNDEDVKEVK
jgi:SecD/SecF fusion protein